MRYWGIPRDYTTHNFENLCKDIGANYQHLLLHTEVKWLSKGRALEQLIGVERSENAILIRIKVEFF